MDNQVRYYLQVVNQAATWRRMMELKHEAVEMAKKTKGATEIKEEK